MSKYAHEYDVTFPFKAKDGYYYGENGKIGPYHHGEDLDMPVGIPVKVLNTVIGYSGNTGESSGPHLHVDRMRNGKWVKPGKWWNTNGEVTYSGWLGSAGMVVIIKADDGSIYRFLHLSKLKVKRGKKIKDMYKGKYASYWGKKYTKLLKKYNTREKWRLNLKAKHEALEKEHEKLKNKPETVVEKEKPYTIKGVVDFLINLFRRAK